MHSKLAGHLSLQELITETIESSRTKMAAFEEKDDKEGKKEEKKPFPFAAKKGKKEEKDEESEKKSSANPIDPSDPEQVYKLASALEAMGDDMLKESDSKNLGGESHQGGMVLPTASPLSGTQSYKRDKSKSHNVPMSTGLEAKKDTGPAATATPDTQHSGHVPVTAAYPKKGVLKTAAEGKCTCGEGAEEKGTCEYCKSKMTKEKKSSPAVSALQAALTKRAGFEDLKAKADKKADEKKEKVEGKKDEKEKKSSPSIDFILNKIAESSQGGMTLDSKSGEGPKPASGSAGGNDARKALESNAAATNLKKVDAKKPQKRMLSEVLTEPAMSKAHDSKVQDNLRNASKGGVKIAAVKAFLGKVASDPNDPNHEKLKTALAKMKGKKEKDSMGVGSMHMGGTPSSTPGMM